jgi:hypothetical protein
MQAEKMAKTNRYVVTAAGTVDQWTVWDTMRDAPVFGAEALSKEIAHDVAHRLNDAYRQLYPKR